MKFIIECESVRRKVVRLTVVVLLIALIWSGSAESDNGTDGYQILVPGRHRGEDIDHLDGGRWYGMFRTDSGYFLEVVDVQFTPCWDPVVDGPNDTTGISVTVEDPRTLIFLLRSPRPLETGQCSALYYGSKWIFPGELTELGDYIITAMGHLTEEGFRSPREPLVLSYRLILFKKPVHYGPRQLLVEHDRTCAEDTPRLIWAGDLDHDGKLDLLMDIDNHYAPTTYGLFLSSEAEGDDLVKLVAVFRRMGC